MRLLIFSALFLSGSLYAQLPDSLKTKKWAIGLSYSPDFCFRQKYADGMTIYSGETEKPKAGMTAGVNFLYKLLDRVGIEVAVLYSTKGQKVHYSSVNWITPQGNGPDNSIPNYNSGSAYKPAERTSTYTYKYLEIPLKVNWYAINDRIKVFPSLGVSANIFIGKKTVSEYNFEEGGTEKETYNTYNPKNIPAADMAILVGVGLGYDINKNLFVKVEPSYRQFIRPLVDAPVSGFFYSLGMNTGIYCRF